MRRRVFKKVLMAITAAAMVMSAQAVMAEEEDYTVITDENGDPIDLGGMEIVIRNWWSPDEPAAPTNDYEEEREYYREWRARNPEKVKASQAKYWARKAEEMRAAGVVESRSANQ